MNHKHHYGHIHQRWYLGHDDTTISYTISIITTTILYPFHCARTISNNIISNMMIGAFRPEAQARGFWTPPLALRRKTIFGIYWKTIGYSVKKCRHFWDMTKQILDTTKERSSDIYYKNLPNFFETPPLRIPAYATASGHRQPLAFLTHAS